MQKGVINKKHIFLTILFAVYMSEYMLSLICMDRSAYALAETGAMLHYLKTPALMAGFLLFPLSRRLGRSIRIRRTLFICLNLIYITGMILITGAVLPEGIPVYMASCIISLLALGFLGGAVYYYMAAGFVNHPCMGRLSGIGGAAAFLIQTAALYMISSPTALLILLLAGFVISLYITLSTHQFSELIFDEPLEYAEKGDSALPGKNIIFAGIASITLCYMICGMTDTILISMNFAGDMSIYAWPRLFGAVGYIIGGVLADLQNREWLHTSAFAMSLLCIPIPLILAQGSFYFGVCLYYIIVVAQIVFLNIYFWDLAPKTSHPEFWSGMSRILASAVSMIMPLFSGISVMSAVIIEVVFTLTAMIFIVSGGFFPKRETAAAALPETGNPDTPVDHIALFSERYNLTPREWDLLKLMLERDDEVPDLAASMNVSTRTVYRHLNNIYEKTGTESRYAIMRLYYETKESALDPSESPALNCIHGQN